jgi:hypothetical protein
MHCEMLCADSPTPSPLSCIESSTCASLASSFEKTGTACGIGTADGGSVRAIGSSNFHRGLQLRSTSATRDKRASSTPSRSMGRHGFTR